MVHRRGWDFVLRFLHVLFKIGSAFPTLPNAVQGHTPAKKKTEQPGEK